MLYDNPDLPATYKSALEGLLNAETEDQKIAVLRNVYEMGYADGYTRGFTNGFKQLDFN